MKNLSCVTGLQHLGLPTKDLENTIQFYEKLGFTVINRERIPSDGQPAAFLNLNGLILEVYQQKDSSGQRGAWDHVALDVTDIRKAWEEVHKCGIKPLETEIQFLPFWENGVAYFNIQGPDQEIIEFIQKQ